MTNVVTLVEDTGIGRHYSPSILDERRVVGRRGTGEDTSFTGSRDFSPPKKIEPNTTKISSKNSHMYLDVFWLFTEAKPERRQP